MYERIKIYTLARPYLKRILGVILVIFGLFALVMPLVPGAVLALVGLELLGLRLIFLNRILPKKWHRQEKNE